MKKEHDNTPEQQAVLDIENENIIVSAQAGAGKTRVLVQRILQYILKEKVSLENMLIVTFTKKAANEMKDRIRKTLMEALDKEGADAVWIYTQLNNVASANIQTMHAFCLEVLQEHFDLLGRDPSFRILNEKTLGQLQEQAMNEVLDKIYQTEEQDIAEFAEVYGFTKRKSDEPLRELISRLYSIANNQTFPEEWLDQEIARMGSDQYSEETYNIWYNEFIVSELVNLAYSMQSYGQHMDDFAIVDKVKDVIEADLVYLTTLFYHPYIPFHPDGVRPSDFEDKGNKLKEKWELLPDTIKFDRFPTIRKDTLDHFELALKELVQAERKSLKAQADGLISSIKGLLNTDIKQENLMMQEVLSILAGLAKDYGAAYTAAKDEENGIDFADIEHDMVKLLERESVVNELKDRYAYIFFDEYQDASGIQNYIVEKISRKDNLFFVGDIKQSIYGFRLAEPKNFMDRYYTYSQEGFGNKALDLTANFRSMPVILRFINFIFSPLMTEERGSIPFDTDTHRSNSKKDDLKKIGSVNVVILEDKVGGDEDEEDDDRPASALDGISSQAFYVAQKIQELVQQGRSYKDFAILFRTKHRIFQFERILNEFNIPFYSDSETVKATSTEAAVFIQLLRLIDNGRIDLTLLSSLSSIAGGFSDEELGNIRVAYQETSFHESFYAYANDEEPKDSILQAKIRRFLEKIEGWRKLMKRTRLSDFIWTVLIESGLYAFYSSLLEGEARRENLNAIVRIAKEYEHEASASLFGFLRYLETEDGKNGETLPTASDLSEEDNVVRLMTIHKSKGLEFPIVFIVEIERESRDQTAKEIISSHSRLGLSIRRKYIDVDSGLIVNARPIRQNLIRRINRTEDIQEQMRVLYVAMTRAEDQLYLVGQVDDMEKVFDKPKGVNLDSRLDNGTSYMQWILSVLLNDHLLRERATVGSNLSMEIPLATDDYFDLQGLSSMKDQINIIFDEGSKYREITPTTSSSSKDKDLGNTGELVKLLDYPYPHQKEVSYPIKNTVSEISKKNQTLDDHFKEWPRYQDSPSFEREERRPPLFIEESKSVSPAEWGSRMHLAFQLLPVKDYNAQTLAESLDSLVERELLTQEERASLDEGLILNFFKSELGRDIIDNGESVLRETAFTMIHNIDGVNINIDGQIDLVYEKDDKLYLVDFKTDRSPIAEKYRDQLYFYTEAIKRAYPNKKVETASLYWVRSGQVSVFETN